MYFDSGGDFEFRDALWMKKRQRIIDLFMDKYPRRNRSTMTALACNSYTPIEIVEFILKHSSDLVYQWGDWNEKIEDRLRDKKRSAMRHAEHYLSENEEELDDHEKSLIYDYLYQTGQRESCIKALDSLPVTSKQQKKFDGLVGFLFFIALILLTSIFISQPLP
jgi:hypothetical protein